MLPINEDALEIEDSSVSPDSTVMSRCFFNKVIEASDKISPLNKRVFLMIDVELKDPQDVAIELNVPYTTVRNRLHRGRKEIREILRSEGFSRP